MSDDSDLSPWVRELKQKWDDDRARVQKAIRRELKYLYDLIEPPTPLSDD